MPAAANLNFMKLKKTLLWAFLLLASPSHGAVYVWKDTAGIRHYTNKEYEIPERYRSRAKLLYSGQEAGTLLDGPSPQPSVQNVMQLPPPTQSSVLQPQVSIPEQPKPDTSKVKNVGRTASSREHSPSEKRKMRHQLSKAGSGGE